MKRIYFAPMCLLVSAAVAQGNAMFPNPPAPGAAPQVKDDLLAGAEKFAAGAEDVSEVNMDKNALGLVSGSGAKSDAAHKMDFIVVRSYTYKQPGMYRMEDVDVFRKRLEDGTWNCVVHERSKNEASDICVRKGSDNETNELIVISAGPKELSFVHMKGRVALGDLSKMGNLPMVPLPPTPPPPPPPFEAAVGLGAALGSSGAGRRRRLGVTLASSGSFGFAALRMTDRAGAGRLDGDEGA